MPTAKRRTRPTGNPDGQPTKLTPALAARLLALIREGQRVTVACTLCGVHRDTLYGWLELGRGAAAHAPFVAFVAAYELAAAEFERAQVRRGLSADGVRARNAQWILAVRFPDAYSRKVVNEVSGPKGGPIEVSTDPAERKRRIAELLAKARGPNDDSGAGPRPADGG